jgi:hypothetical protein
MRYSGRKAGFLTQHGKDTLLSSLFDEKLGCEIVRADGFDTDQLGTFTRDINRPGSQLAAARIKAKKAIELTGHEFGLGSEGAFGADPVGGILPWNTEVLVWLERDSDLEVIGFAQGPGGGLHQNVKNLNELRDFADKADFPNHGLVIMPNDQSLSPIFKGIKNWATLEKAFFAALNSIKSDQVFVEVDLRAHMNPSRQKMIFQAAEDLIKKLISYCPACSAPGYWKKESVSGLLCSLCSRPTRLPIANIWRCDACGFTERKELLTLDRADPSKCDYCNP